MSNDAPYFGIDFGTTNSNMVPYDPDEERAEIILNDHDEAKTAYLVYFGEKGFWPVRMPPTRSRNRKQQPDSR